jgi:mono/diheme cytochrome c family protein
MKNSYISKRIYRAVFLLLFAVIFINCDRNRNTTGWDYFPDMFYSTAYETFTKNPNFSDGMTMRVPVPGTVPRDITPFNYTIDPESRILAGKELINPESPTAEALLRGKTVYSTFCAGCHGDKGAGDGPLFAGGLYPLKPRNLTDIPADNLKDGEIFHSITLGFGSMGAHGSQIRSEDRWKVVLYIRGLQAKEKEAQIGAGAGIRK